MADDIQDPDAAYFTALQKADAAGDTAGATSIANMIKQRRADRASSAAQPPATGAAPLPAAPGPPASTPAATPAAVPPAARPPAAGSFPRAGNVPRPETNPELDAAWNALPWYAKPFNYAGNMLDSGINDFSLGYAKQGDAAAAALGTKIKDLATGSDSGSFGDNYTSNLLDRINQIKAAQHVTGASGHMLGGGLSLLVPGVPLEAGIARVLPEAPGLMNLAGRAGMRLAGGAAIGGTEGAINASSNKPLQDLTPQDIWQGFKTGAELGGPISAAVPAVTGALGNVAELGARTAGLRRPSVLPSTVDLQEQAKAAYDNLRSGGHSWDRQQVDTSITGARSTPRMQTVIAGNAPPGSPTPGYSGAYPGTNRANTDIDNQLAAQAAQGRTTVDFDTIDRMIRDTRAQANARPEAGGDTGPHQPYRDLTTNLDAVTQTPTTVGTDLMPELTAAKAAFANSKNSALMDDYMRTGNVNPLLAKIRKDPQFFSQAQIDSANALDAASRAGPGPIGQGLRRMAYPVGSELGALASHYLGGGPLASTAARVGGGTMAQGLVNAMTGRGAARALTAQTDATRRVLTGQPPPPGTPWADAINAATSQDRLRMALSGLAIPGEGRTLQDPWGRNAGGGGAW